jgi:radical SAM superfamily enzyme YgiQ (UPF0313 family)
MKVLLVNPPRVKGYPVVREERFEHKDIGSVYPPLSLLYTASLIQREGFEVRLIDANGVNLSLSKLSREIREYKPQVLFIRAAFDTQEEDLKVLKMAKSLGNCKTVLRNKIISEVPQLRDILLKREYVDIFLNQEPESVIIPLLKALEENSDLAGVRGISFKKKGKIFTNPPAELLEKLDCLPFPAYHLLPDLKPYHTGVMGPIFATVITSRGCPFNCTFCAYGKAKYRVRSPENVVEELTWLKEEFNLKNFLFFDDLIGLKKGRMERLCSLMLEKDLKLKWVCCTRANLINREMLKLMKEAGCREVALGVESGSEKVLRRTKKGIELKDIREAAGLIKEAGILFYAMFILGLPGETEETVKETINFVKEIDPFYAQFCFSTPFPNTEAYSYYEKNNLLLTKDWERYFPLGDFPIARTKALSAKDLVRLRKEAYKRLLLRPKYLLSKISLTNWKWNLKGAKEILSRILSILKGKAVR